MHNTQKIEVTRILADMSAGDDLTASKLLPILYEELRELARRRLVNEPAGITLQATALVHEAYLRLVGDENARWENRGHFFAAAAEAMRRILVERARRSRAVKHGGGRERISLDAVDVGDPTEPTEDLIELDAALMKLEAQDAIRSKVVKLRYFAGLTIDQTAEALGISHATVERYWTFSKAWLRAEMNREPPGA